MAKLNERLQRALLAAGLRVPYVCVEPEDDNTGLCSAVALGDGTMQQDAPAVLDGFRLHYRPI